MVHWKRPWCWERLREGEEGVTEDEMVGWHYQLHGHEFERTPGDSEGQGSLECCSSWGHKESDTTVTEQQQMVHPVKAGLRRLKPCPRGRAWVGQLGYHSPNSTGVFQAGRCWEREECFQVILWPLGFSPLLLSPDHFLWTVLLVLLLEREETFAPIETASKVLSVKITKQMLCSTSQGEGRSGRQSRASVTLIDIPLYWRKHVQCRRRVPNLILGSENRPSGWRVLYPNCGFYDRGPGRCDCKLKQG